MKKNKNSDKVEHLGFTKENIDPTFDNYAGNYHETLNKALNASGEDSEYFATKRIEWTKIKLEKLAPNNCVKNVLDFGCGTGDSIPILNTTFKPEILAGTDPSEKSIEVAKANHSSEITGFYTVEELPETVEYDLIYCNGVFHHIPPTERSDALKIVLKSLSPDGSFALWENNPWNPGTKYVMSKCPFDEDAVTLSCLKAKKLLTNNGFKIINISFKFIFPKALGFLRFIEKPLSPLPIGAQYLILAKKTL